MDYAPLAAPRACALHVGESGCRRRRRAIEAQHRRLRAELIHVERICRLQRSRKPPTSRLYHATPAFQRRAAGGAYSHANAATPAETGDADARPASPPLRLAAQATVASEVRHHLRIGHLRHHLGDDLPADRRSRAHVALAREEFRAQPPDSRAWRSGGRRPDVVRARQRSPARRPTIGKRRAACRRWRAVGGHFAARRTGILTSPTSRPCASVATSVSATTGLTAAANPTGERRDDKFSLRVMACLPHRCAAWSQAYHDLRTTRWRSGSSLHAELVATFRARSLQAARVLQGAKRCYNGEREAAMRGRVRLLAYIPAILVAAVVLLALVLRIALGGGKRLEDRTGDPLLAAPAALEAVVEPRLPAGQHRRIGRRARLLHAPSRRRSTGQGPRAGRRPTRHPIPTRRSSTPRRRAASSEPAALCASIGQGRAVGARLRRLRARSTASRSPSTWRPTPLVASATTSLRASPGFLSMLNDFQVDPPGQHDLHRRDQPVPAAPGARSSTTSRTRRSRRRARRPPVGGDARTTSSRRPTAT